MIEKISGIPNNNIITDGLGKEWILISENHYLRIEDNYFWGMDPRNDNNIFHALPPTIEAFAYQQKFYN